MNIIKLKDIIKPDDDLFNNHLKGRYAFLVQMRYIVSFDHMDYHGYVACEMDIEKLLQKEDGTYPKPFGCPYIDTYEETCDIYPYIDELETDRINSLQEFKIKNEYVTDSDITIDELKKFRTWLADRLLSFNKNNEDELVFNLYDDTTIIMLLYYKNGMFDDTIKTLTDMSEYKTQIQQTTQCCCGNVIQRDIIYNSTDCDPILMYRTYIYNKMIKVFSDMDFWMQFPSEFILEFKKYIDNILKLHLNLSGNMTCINLNECGYINNTDTIQAQYEYILNQLSESLKYIAEKDTNGHKNYIYDSLNNWATYLYEKMEW